MATRTDLLEWVTKALKAHNGRATIVAVAEHIWTNHRADLEASGDLFFTWQYDMRWAATRLRDLGKVKDADLSPKGVWELT